MCPSESRRRRLTEALWRVTAETVAACIRYRVTGLAAEGAFFAILSMPPLVFALAGTLGYLSDQVPQARIDDIRAAIIEFSSRALTEGAVERVIEPTISEVLDGAVRYDVISIGFVLSLWSGSRALNVFVDTITIMHGLGGHRGIVATRALSFGLYVLGMVTGVVTIPLVVAGPGLVAWLLPDRLDFVVGFYWPTVIMLSVVFLATLYHVSVPVRTKWRLNLPGAAFALVCWILGSAVLRWVLTVTAAESRSIYGPLAAPIAVLLWLYIVALAVLVGAAVNGALDTVFPQKATARARLELVHRLRSRMTWNDVRRFELARGRWQRRAGGAEAAEPGPEGAEEAGPGPEGGDRPGGTGREAGDAEPVAGESGRPSAAPAQDRRRGESA